MARAKSGRSRRLVRGTQDLAGKARPQVESERRSRLRRAARRRQPGLRLLAPGRQRSHVSARRRFGDGAVAQDLSGTVHDEPRGRAPWRRTEIDARVCERQVVRDWHDRHRDRVRRRRRPAGVADARVESGHVVHDALVLATRRSRTRRLSRGGTQPGRVDGVRRGHRRRQVALGRRRTGLRLADRRGDRRHAPAHHVHTGQFDRRGRRDRRAALEAGLFSPVHAEQHHADLLQPDADHLRSGTAGGRIEDRPARWAVDDGDGLGE